MILIDTEKCERCGRYWPSHLIAGSESCPICYRRERDLFDSLEVEIECERCGTYWPPLFIEGGLCPMCYEREFKRERYY